MRLRDAPKDESDPSPDLILRPPSPLGRGKKFVPIPLRRGEGGGHGPTGEGSLFGAGPRYLASGHCVWRAAYPETEISEVVWFDVEAALRRYLSRQPTDKLATTSSN